MTTSSDPPFYQSAARARGDDCQSQDYGTNNYARCGDSDAPKGELLSEIRPDAVQETDTVLPKKQ
jgi:hypothetical protein